MSRIDRRPTRLASAVAVVAALVALVAGGRYAWPAFAAGVAGLGLLVAGLARGATGSVTLGASGLVAGGILAGAGGAPAEPVLVAVTAAVLAWDAGSTAVSLGTQLGRAASTTRLEVVHLTGSGLVGLATAALGWGVYRAAAGGQPVATLFFLLLGAVLALAALD